MWKIDFSIQRVAESFDRKLAIYNCVGPPSSQKKKGREYRSPPSTIMTHCITFSFSTRFFFLAIIMLVVFCLSALFVVLFLLIQVDFFGLDFPFLFHSFYCRICSFSPFSQLEF